MKKRKKVTYLVSVMAIFMLIGGCGSMKEAEVKIPETIPVQDYVGQYYPMEESQEDRDYIKAHKAELDAAAIKYYKDEFKLDVEVMGDIWPSKGAAIAHVKTTTWPYLKLGMIMQLNKQGEKPIVSGTYDSQMQTGVSIMSGLYWNTYEDEFKNLDAFLETQKEKYGLVGTRSEYTDMNTSSYNTNDYFVSTTEISFPDIYKKFLENPQMNEKELKDMFEKELTDTKNEKRVGITIGVNLYVSKGGEEPSGELVDAIYKELREQKGLPTGTYTIRIRPNEIQVKIGSALEGISAPRLATDKQFTVSKGRPLYDKE